MTTPTWGEPGYQPPPRPDKPKRSRRQKILLAVAGIIAALWVIGSLAGDPKPASAPAVTDAPVVTATTAPTTDQPATTETPATKATAAPTTVKPKPELTTSQEQAIGSAESYLDTGHFSRSGLISQLKFEGFSRADAAFAVDHLHVNWREQAVGTARDYLDTGHFSRSGLIAQLEYEGFSKTDATYAASKVGL